MSEWVEVPLLQAFVFGAVGGFGALLVRYLWERFRR